MMGEAKSRCGRYLGYNDEWILENIKRFTSWRNLFNEYYKIFGYGSYRNFRNHLYHDLNLTRSFTKDQDEWLINNYSDLGVKECTKIFNERFLCGRSESTIRGRAFKLGLKVNEKVVRKLHSVNAKQYSIGSTVVRTNREGVSSVWQKTEDGWVRQAHLNVGYVPRDKIVVHLDHDYSNNSKENLAIISKRVNALMVINEFWSENPTITKTGIMCCELESCLKG